MEPGQDERRPRTTAGDEIDDRPAPRASRRAERIAPPEIDVRQDEPREHTSPVDERVGSLAARQFGVVSRRQLTDLGLGKGAIAGRVARGTLRRQAQGVYAVGRPADHPNAPFAAALLALRSAGWVAGRSAGALWDVLPLDAAAPVEVVVLGPPPRSRPGVRVRATTRLDHADRARRATLPVTGLARTLVDLAEQLDAGELERAVAEAIALHDLNVAAVRSAMERRPATRGCVVLRGVLDAADGPRRSRSEAEARFLALVRDARLPVPATDVRIGGFRVDAFWARERVVAEVDGFAFHRSRRKFDLDRERDAVLQSAGYLVFRATWRQIVDEPTATAARLAAVLVRRSSEPR